MKCLLSTPFQKVVIFLFLLLSHFNIYAGDIKLMQEFRGIYAGAPTFGDLFGNSLSINEKDLFVGSPGANVNDATACGALYFYRKTPWCEWETSQPPFVLPVFLNFTGYNQVVSRENWLFVSLTNTPSDSSIKNYAGSVLVFKKIDRQWVYVATLDNPKGTVDGQNEYFGAHFASDGKKWLVVGGDNTDSVYAYRLNKETENWELAQTLNPPGLSSSNKKSLYIGYNCEHLLVSAIPYNFPGSVNGQVFAYELEEDQWNYTQTLEGISPISTVYNTGDAFGKAVAIHHSWAVIGAPTDNQLADLAGAVYFFHFDEHEKQWVKTLKFYSEIPTVFFGWNASIEKNIAVVGDPGRTHLTDDGRQLFRGAAVVFRRHPITWKQGERTWSPIETLIDPCGKPYDFYGAGGIDIHQGYIGVGSNPLTNCYLPNSYPNKNPCPSQMPLCKGHVLLYKNQH